MTLGQDAGADHPGGRDDSDRMINKAPAYISLSTTGARSRTTLLLGNGYSVSVIVRCRRRSPLSSSPVRVLIFFFSSRRRWRRARAPGGADRAPENRCGAIYRDHRPYSAPLSYRSFVQTDHTECDRFVRIFESPSVLFFTTF